MRVREIPQHLGQANGEDHRLNVAIERIWTLWVCVAFQDSDTAKLEVSRYIAGSSTVDSFISS